MKKVLLIAMVMCIAIPALAVEITIENSVPPDSKGTIKLVVGAGEVVRGLAIIVDATSNIEVVSGTDTGFNVFMDAAWWEETTGGNQYGASDEYEVGEGGPVADPEGKGPLSLPEAKISLCMGKVDISGGQAGLPEGIYVVAIIDFGTSGSADVTITEDDLRGGIVGDNLGASTMPAAAFPITAAATTYDVTVTIESAAAATAGCIVTLSSPNPQTANSTVTLTPVAATGWNFDAWGTSDDEGDLSDNFDGSWDLSMNDNKAVTAIFEEVCPCDVTNTHSGYIPPDPFNPLGGFDINLWTGPSGAVNLDDLNAIVQLLIDENNTNADWIVTPVPAAAEPLDVTNTHSGYIPPDPFNPLGGFDRGLWTGPNGEVNLDDLNAITQLLIDENNTNADWVWDCP